MPHAGPSGKPPTQLTNTETCDRKRWSRSKLGQPAAIYTRAGAEYRGLCAQRRSDTPLRYAVVPGQNDGNTRREQQQQRADKHHAFAAVVWKGSGTTRTDLSQYVIESPGSREKSNEAPQHQERRTKTNTDALKSKHSQCGEGVGQRERQLQYSTIARRRRKAPAAAGGCSKNRPAEWP